MCNTWQSRLLQPGTIPASSAAVAEEAKQLLKRVDGLGISGANENTEMSALIEDRELQEKK